MKETKRVQLDVTKKGLQDILELKQLLETATMADAIRSSVRIVKKLEKERKEGNRVVIIDKNNKERDIEFL